MRTQISMRHSRFKKKLYKLYKLYASQIINLCEIMNFCNYLILVWSLKFIKDFEITLLAGSRENLAVGVVLKNISSMKMICMGIAYHFAHLKA